MYLLYNKHPITDKPHLETAEIMINNEVRELCNVNLIKIKVELKHLVDFTTFYTKETTAFELLYTNPVQERHLL